MTNQAERLRLSGSAVVIADDDAARCDEIIGWLMAHDVHAYATSDTSVIRLIEEVRARVVICWPGSAGVALFHALQEAADPPMVVLLCDAPSARDEIYGDGRLLVAIVRTPVHAASLARFVSSVVRITSPLDAAARQGLAAAAADGSVPPAPKGAVRSRLEH